MSSNNNEMQSASMALAMVGALSLLLIVFVYAFLAFLAAVLTVVAFLAWSRPRQFLGQTVYPEEAQSFVYRGVAGAVWLPAFLTFCELLFKFRFDWNTYGIHVFIIGYIIGSIGIEMMRGDPSARSALDQPQPPTIDQRPLPPAGTAHRDTSPAGFRFATWDDEEDAR